MLVNCQFGFVWYFPIVLRVSYPKACHALPHDDGIFVPVSLMYTYDSNYISSYN